MPNTFQVTFSSDEITAARRVFDEVGKYSTIEQARHAAKAKVEAYYGKPLNREQFHVEQTPDEDFQDCEDWFVAALGKGSKAVVVAINCLPLTQLRASTKQPYDSGMVSKVMA